MLGVVNKLLFSKVCWHHLSKIVCFTECKKKRDSHLSNHKLSVAFWNFHTIAPFLSITFFKKLFDHKILTCFFYYLSIGLDYIHSKLLVHLDVKPENIFISVDYPMRISEHSSNQSSPINDIENSNPAKVISPNTENIMNKKEATSTEEEIFR